jgi:hypothetical protein
MHGTFSMLPAVACFSKIGYDLQQDRVAANGRLEGSDMPLHDWTDDRGWDSVHPFWLAYLVEWIQSRLPEGYKAFLGGVPALTMAAGNGKPDISVRQWGPAPPGEEAVIDTAVVEPDLEMSVAFRLDPQPAVRIDFHGRPIAVIELVSPHNKDRADAKGTYASYLGYLRLGVHLMLVDVLPRPKGFSFSDAITGALGIELPPLPPPTASAKSSRSQATWAASWGSGAGSSRSVSRCHRSPCP